MRLADLLEESDVTHCTADPDTHVTGLAFDSRRVRPGDLFFALAGARHDGGAFVRDALGAGAVAVVVGEGLGSLPGPACEVREPRLALAVAATRFHRHPSRELAVVGVTGTNGKTTTTFLLESVFRAAGFRAGVIGTTGVRLDGERRPASFTTPEAPDLQGLLREMADRGVRGVALEVSSHALAQRRSYGLECDALVFTNLSHDHLDYHGTLERYLDAKLMLFDGRNGTSQAKRGVAVVNLDDAAAPAVLAAAQRGGHSAVTYGRGGGAELRIDVVEPGPQGLAIRLATGAQAIEFRLPLFGRYNAWNAAAAWGAARALGVEDAVIRRGLEATSGVPGRLEPVQEGQDFQVVVDYAHTPDALASALAAARDHAAGRVLLVFGCGGDRDRTKRPVMGRIAATSADLAWVTSDNPRSEDPAAIVAEVRAGDAEGCLRAELDRGTAIGAALAEARAGDVVVIAGKGHETTQTAGDREIPFDDREVAREWLRGSTRKRR